MQTLSEINRDSPLTASDHLRTVTREIGEQFPNITDEQVVKLAGQMVVSASIETVAGVLDGCRYQLGEIATAPLMGNDSNSIASIGSDLSRIADAIENNQ